MWGYFCIGLIDFMLAGKTLTEFTNLFPSNNFKKNDDIIKILYDKIFYGKCLKMAERNSSECNPYETHNIYLHLGVSLNYQQQFRLNKINEIKDYFVAEIKKRELMSKRLSKYIAYFDKPLIVLSVTTGSIFIASFAAVIGAPVGIVSVICSLAFSVFAGIVKKLLKTTRDKKKKRNKIVVLTRGKLNTTKSKISEALINREMSHEDFITILMTKEILRITRKH